MKHCYIAIASDFVIFAEHNKVSASRRNLYLVGCTTNIGLKARRHDSDEVFASTKAN